MKGDHFCVSLADKGMVGCVICGDNTCGKFIGIILE